MTDVRCASLSLLLALGAGCAVQFEPAGSNAARDQPPGADLPEISPDDDQAGGDDGGAEEIPDPGPDAGPDSGEGEGEASPDAPQEVGGEGEASTGEGEGEREVGGEGEGEGEGEGGPGNEGAGEGEAEGGGEGEGEPCVAELERCNGVDDDCDGLIDEEPFDAGRPCSVGLGICNRSGELVCVDGEIDCSVFPGDPAEVELCNGDDDDCDGEVDADAADAGALCEAGVGECHERGEVECVQGELRCNVEGGDPAPNELCNGLDDDCDGQIDEESVDMGGQCFVGVGACRTEGTIVCEGGEGVCGARAGEPDREVCDEIDNDCDGRVDEALDCDVCDAPCPAERLEGGEAVCVAVDHDQPCPEGWNRDLGVRHRGAPELEGSCAACACTAELDPEVYITSGCGVQSPFAHRPVDCVQEECEVDYCDRGLAAHNTSITLRVQGGGPQESRCVADDGDGMRMCCRDALPTPPGCLAPACPVPHGAEGPVIVQDGPGLVGCDAGETLWARAEPVGFQCAACPCRAVATTATCDGEVTTTCVATTAFPECATACTGRLEGSLHTVEIDGHGDSPDVAAGRCELHGRLTMCDPLGAM